MPLVWTNQPWPVGNAVRSAGVSPTTGTVIAINSNASSAFRNTDGGITWNFSTPVVSGVSGNVFSDGTAFVTSDASGNVFQSLDDGQTWTGPIAISGMPGSQLGFAADGAGAMVAVSIGFGAGWFVSRSLDHGATWSAAAPVAGGHHFLSNCILWDGTQFVAHGWDTGFTWNILTSPDGITWTVQAVESVFTNYPVCFAYDGTEYITGLINNTAIRRGANIANFIAASDVVISPPFGVSTSINAIAASTGMMVAGDQFTGGGNSPNLGESTDEGATWTLDSVPSPGSGVYATFALYNPIFQDFMVWGTGTLGFLFTSPFSSGVAVPNVVGQPIATAESNITGVGLTVGVVTMAASGSVPAGDVISTNPVAGTILALGSPVDIVESAGPAIAVPNVVGLSLAAATSAITGAGLVVGTVSFVSSFTIPNGDIAGQSPVGGTLVAAGSSVDLAESTGPATTTVPNIIGDNQAAATAALLAANLVLNAPTFTSSTTVPAGAVISQNPIAGTVVNVGSGVDAVISTGLPLIAVPNVIGDTLIVGENAIISASLNVGPITAQVSPSNPIGTILGQFPVPGTLVPAGTVVELTSVSAFASSFPVDQTVISQYANSPTLLQLVHNMAQYVDQSVNFVNFFQFVWNVDTAVGFGLDIWGRIVGVSRLLHIGANTDTFGFENSDRPYDWQNFGGGTFFNGGSGTAYLLPDDAYRILILTKALANITATTSQALNQLLRNLFPGRGVCYVQDNLDMTMTFVFKFPLTPIEFAILTQSGALPHPAGVGFNVLVVPPDRFGFQEAGPAALPFNFGVFYLPS